MKSSYSNKMGERWMLHGTTTEYSHRTTKLQNHGVEHHMALPSDIQAGHSNISFPT